MELSLDSDLSHIPCTKCHQAGGLRIEMRIEADPLGSSSLAGIMIKTTAREWPWMTCDLCGSECRGKIQ